MKRFDAIDLAILNYLQIDGRLSNAELADKINLSPSATLRRVKLLEDRGVIDGYAMLLNQKAIGKPTDIFVEISLNSQSEVSLNKFESAVKECPDVMECYLMSGDSDYLLHIVVTDTEDYERVHKEYLSCLPNVSRIRSSFAIRKISKKTAFSLN